ncbi:MAG: aminoacetone oxidase family FAD-binding enzyme, partial [Clostridia bacterium]|nr:aminoacetone oxidase family FAD-binding enzyme [Clostridia bacterium]
GKSYTATGIDGAGYKFAKMVGHTVETPVPALCPMVLKGDIASKLQGVSLKNVQMNVVADGKKLDFFGEMLFTDRGISGPIVLSSSSFVNRAKDVSLTLDFKPALTQEQLDVRLLRDFENAKNKNLKFVLYGLLPKAVASVFAETIGIDENKKIHDITKAERKMIVENLKCFKLSYGGLYDIDAGIITSGGVSLKEINPKTFESKLVSGLYFLGEVLDVDALTGGFNLQVAWASSVCCAKNFDL